MMDMPAKIIHQLRLGTRGSALAKAQVEEVFGLLRIHGIDMDFRVEVYQNRGDLDKISSLQDSGKDDFFTDALDRALREGEIDVAVHSAKDLPQVFPPDLDIFALTASLDETDAFVGHTPLARLPAGARIGTSSELRRKYLQLMNPEWRAVPIRGTIQERLRQFQSGVYDGLVVATAALKRLELTDLIQDLMPWDAMPLQGQLAVVGRKDDQSVVRRLWEPLDVRRKYGTVFLVGAGPGDPELITLKGVSVLKRADVVFYDYLAHKGILKHATRAEKIYVGKKRGDHSFRQPDISRLIRQRAQQGQTVVRLKGGDPLLFARGAEEMMYLRNFYVPCEVIPGVASGTGIPAELGIPLTAREVSSSVAFVSAYGKEEGVEGLKPIKVPRADTLVFFMGLSKLELILQALLEQGYNEQVPVAVVSRGTFIDEKVVIGCVGTIQKMARDAGIMPPALIIVGETVKFYRQRPLMPRTILYTGTNPEKYAALGRIIHMPMIRIQPREFPESEARFRIAQIGQFQKIIFTSQFAVRSFFQFLRFQGFDLKRLNTVDFWVIGRHTARTLEQFGFSPAVTANIETSQGLLEKIRQTGQVQGVKILFPRSNLPNPYLSDELTRLGAFVEEWTVYENLKAENVPLPQERVDAVFFTSPSTVRNFLEYHGGIPEDWMILSKGEVTQEYLKLRGYNSEILINS